MKITLHQYTQKEHSKMIKRFCFLDDKKRKNKRPNQMGKIASV